MFYLGSEILPDVQCQIARRRGQKIFGARKIDLLKDLFAV